MEAIMKVDQNTLLRRARQAVIAGDLNALGAVIAEVENQQRAFLAQAREEIRQAQEAERGLAEMKTRLAFLPEDEARRQYGELSFAIDLRSERARACQQQSETLNKLLTDLRKLSEEVQARVLAASLVIEAQDVEEELRAVVSDCLPRLRAIVERALALSRQARDFNYFHQHAQVPLVSLLGDPGSVNKLGDLKLNVPEELEQLARSERKKVSENGSEWQSLA